MSAVWDDTPWLTIAKQELGVHEIDGAGIEPRIVEYHLATTLGATDDAVPWCASFVSWCLQKAGAKSTRSARAASYATYGTPVGPEIGAVVVTKRKGGNHVGFLVEKTPFGVKLLGGNQSDMVCIKEFADSQVIAIRWPEMQQRTNHGANQ